MKKKLLFVFLISLVVFLGCGKSKNELILGKWEVGHGKEKMILTFTSDGYGNNSKENNEFKWKIEGDSLYITYLDRNREVDENEETKAIKIIDINETEFKTSFNNQVGTGIKVK